MEIVDNAGVEEVQPLPVSYLPRRRFLFSAKKRRFAQRYKFPADNRTASAEDTLEELIVCKYS